MAILAQSYQGINGGMNQAVPQHEIPDGQASYMQDVLLSVPGVIKRRGPLTKYSGSTTVPFRATGMATVQDPTGAYRTAVFAGDATHAYVYFYSADLTSKVGPYQLPDGVTKFDPASPRYIVDAKPALGGGTLIGISSSYLPGAGVEAGLYLWKGAVQTADISAANCTNAHNSTAVTSATGGAFSSVTAGMFVYFGARYLGTVQSVTSATALVLESPGLNGFDATLAAGTATLTFVPFKNILPLGMKGRISVAAGARYINGTQGPAGTKFTSFPTAGSASAHLYRLSDGNFIASSSAGVVVDNATIDLGVSTVSSLATGMTDERYFAQESTGGRASGSGKYSITIATGAYTGLNYSVGFLNSVWNGRQWYANRPRAALGEDLYARVWFSDTAQLDGLDTSTDDGDFIDIQSSQGVNTPIIAIQGIPAGLCVFKENELFLITGSDYTNFSVRKVADTGTLSTGSVQPMGAGVIWAGRDGIFYFDGQAIRSLSTALGDYWTQSIKGFSTVTNRMGSYTWKNNYVLFVDSFASTFTIRKAAATTTPTTVAFCINLDTFAVTTFTNMAVKDSTTMPAGSGIPTLILVDDGGTPGTTSLADASLIHSATGTGPDTITCGTQTIGPDFYVETKKYDLGDPERKKLFKQLAMNFILTGDVLNMDTVPGLNSTGTAINTAWQTQSAWTNLRKKFTKRDTHLQFRLYQNSSSVTDVRIGPLSLGFKLQRVGRV